MVMFHSYVSLPEGSFDHLSIRMAVCTLTYIVHPICQPSIHDFTTFGRKIVGFWVVDVGKCAIQLPQDSGVKKIINMSYLQQWLRFIYHVDLRGSISTFW